MKNIRKSIVGQCLIILIISQAFLLHQQDVKVAAEWTKGMNPGMMLRIDKGSITGFK